MKVIFCSVTRYSRVLMNFGVIMHDRGMLGEYERIL